jgi:hypothetical protein
MRDTKHFILSFVVFLSLTSLSVVAGGQTRATVQNSRLIVSFYSICCGIDGKAKEKLETFIKNYERAKGKRLTKEAIRWGKEGEVDYCFRLSELSPGEQKRFISKIRLLLKQSKLVHITENAACRSER